MYCLKDFDEYDFLHHYRNLYVETENPYSYYEPAYRYGFDLAYSYPYRNRGWSALEEDARRFWERRYPRRDWEEFREAIQYAWEQVRRSTIPNSIRE